RCWSRRACEDDSTRAWTAPLQGWYRPRMDRLFGTLGSLAGGLTVAAGALGAHALKDALPAERLAAFEAAVRYQLVHALALLAVGLWSARAPSRVLSAAGWAFAAGIALFSGSLYALA